MDIDLDRIVATAVEMANEEGHESVTIRRLARTLGVAPMSIYGYIDSKDDLLDRMTAQMMDRFEVPVSSALDWGEEVFLIFVAFHDLLMANPSLGRLLATRRVISLGVTRKISATLTHLRDAGLSSEVCVRADALLTAYTLGSVDFKLRRTDPGSYPAEDAEIENKLVQFSMNRSFPLVQEFAHDISQVGRTDAFEFGLRLIVNGLRELAGESADSDLR